MSTFRLELRTPAACVFDGEATALLAAGADGQLTVLAGHEPMVALLTEGGLTLRTPDGETVEGIAGDGLLRVSREGAAVLVRTFRRAGEETGPTAGGSAAPRDDALL